ncbi:cyclic AMP-responsive element-binding protein 3 [Phalacrocorax carbo]|uniref:cyclic AMP-responsive element-binding protein 3 n=1 Tax=Phalacrocorax carbo TaxID=9209 RepID=UPI0031193BBD
MSSPEELAAVVDEDILQFLLKDDAPWPELLRQESDVLDNWNVPDPECLDKEMDDFITSLLKSFKDEPDMLEDYSQPDGSSTTSEDPHLSHSPGSCFAGSTRSSYIVQADHNYSLHHDFSAPESMRSDMEEGDASIDHGPWMGLEGTSQAMDQSSGFPAGVAMVTRRRRRGQTNFQQLVLTKEERQLLEKEGFSLPACLPLTKADEQLLKKVRRKIRNKQSAQDSRYRRKLYVDDLESRMAACEAQNHELEKKVQLLQKQNILLLQQLWRLHILVRSFTTKTAAAKTCTVIVVLSFCFFVSASIFSLWGRKLLLELGVLPQQTSSFPNGSESDMQEDAVPDEFISNPEGPSQSGSLDQAEEEGQSPRNAQSSSLKGNSSSHTPPEMGCEEDPPQPQEQLFQSDPSQAAVLQEWRDEMEVCVDPAAGFIVQEHHAEEM